MTASQAARTSWKFHDYLVGILGGGGVGASLGVFVAARLLEDTMEPPLVIAIGAIVGAVIGILLMRQTRENHEGFWTVTTVVMWIVAVASAVFLILLYRALLDFN
ncbi:MAG TPA: hypothetical protein VF246_04525 [Acidimicrobiia bacterium]